MKASIKKVLEKIITTYIGWLILKPIASLGNFLYLSRQNYLKENKKNDIGNSSEIRISPHKFGLVTHEGPFKGLVYPSMKSVGSSLYPKIIGSYEKELWPILNDIKSNNYSEIIDIGCAEGYYAIGFAKMFNNAIINAFDISKVARELCREMAIVNNVSQRVNIHSQCTSEILKKFNFNGKGLIVSDCEGFEKNVFNKENVNNLKRCDLIIETHDFLDINISSTIKDLFEKSHDLISVKSIDDIEKALTYNFKILENLSLEDKLMYLSEHRPSIMEWVICKSKLNNIENSSFKY